MPTFNFKLRNIEPQLISDLGPTFYHAIQTQPDLTESDP